jgi:type II secretory pathway component PulJ
MKIASRQSAGFTLMETTVVSVLMSVLAIVLSSAWAGFERPALSVIAHARVAREMTLAVGCLARDLGGSLGNAEGRLGTKRQGAFVGWLLPGNGQLWLCFDGGTDPNGAADWAAPDTVIVYMLDGDQLVRWDQMANTTFVAARNVQAMDLSLLGDELQINLTFTCQDVTRQCSLTARTP